MSSSLVSIIIPSFNREMLIRETLDSVLEQTYSFWEAIVVDDGSADKTCEVVQSYADKDQRIKLIKRNRLPKSASVCRNIGIENARGKYALFLDSDDLLAPDCLKNRVEYMDAHPALDFAVFQMVYFHGNKIADQLKFVKKRDNYLYSYLRHDLPWHTMCPLWRLDFIRASLKGFNEAYPRLQDPEFNTRALLQNNVKYDVLFDAEIDCYGRSHTDKVFNVNLLLSGFKLYIEEFAGRVKALPDYKICIKQLKNSYIEAVRGFYSYYKPEYQNESIRTLQEINKFALKDKVIGSNTHLLTSVLMQGYKLHLYNKSWGRYILKGIMKLIKTS